MPSVTIASRPPSQSEEPNSTGALKHSQRWALVFERNYHWAAGIVVAAIFWRLNNTRALPTHTLPTTTRDIFRAVATMSTTIVGFLLTACSILVALNQTWIVRKAKKTAGYKLLVQYVFVAIRWAMSTAILTAFSLWFDPEWNPRWSLYGMTIWIFVVSTSITAFWRVVRIYRIILLALSEPES